MRSFFKKHINKYNPCISHYRREHAPNRLYPPSELCCSYMYEDYKISCQEEDRKVYSYITYWRIIKEMNISFAKLGTEECEVCDTYKIHRDYKKQETNGHTSPQRDTAEVVRKKTRKEMDNEEFIECSRICDVCSAYKAH